MARVPRKEADYWPGFVSLMSLLLMVVVFLIAVFILVEFFLAQETSARDKEISTIKNQISSLASQLALAKTEKDSLQKQIYAATDTLKDAEEKERRLLALLEAREEDEDDEVVELSEELKERRLENLQAAAERELLRKQLQDLQKQIASLQQALEAAEEKDRKNKTQIENLSSKLNTALAEKIRELAKARSDFLARLRRILGNREGFQVVGDRFLLQSEVLFDSGSVTINARGQFELRQLAGVINTVSQEIPEDVPWALRVDGHTDSDPINTRRYTSNWQLSLARAIAVVLYLQQYGVAPEQLMASGFGEFQPIDPDDNLIAKRKNRRIEFKISQPLSSWL